MGGMVGIRDARLLICYFDWTKQEFILK